jgi:hypothetical protein
MFDKLVVLCSPDVLKPERSSPCPTPSSSSSFLPYSPIQPQNPLRRPRYSCPTQANNLPNHPTPCNDRRTSARTSAYHCLFLSSTASSYFNSLLSRVTLVFCDRGDLQEHISPQRTIICGTSVFLHATTNFQPKGHFPFPGLTPRVSSVSGSSPSGIEQPLQLGTS